MKINGTDTTRRLIGNIAKDFQDFKPSTSRTSYEIDTYRSENGIMSSLEMRKRDGEFENFSFLRGKWGIALIDNNNGDIFIGYKSLFTPAKKVVSKILAFLEIIQPENISRAKATKPSNGYIYSTPDGLTPTHLTVLEQYFEQSGTKINKTIIGDERLDEFSKHKDKVFDAIISRILTKKCKEDLFVRKNSFVFNDLSV